MNSYTTVASARRTIGGLFSTADFLPYLNQAIERIINGGLWKGVIDYAAFPTVDNYFTLPYPFLSVVGAQWYRCPVPVFGQFHEFTMSGPGRPLDDQAPQGLVEDLGDGYAVQTDIPTSGSTLKVVLYDANDTGRTWRFFGTGAGGVEIYDNDGMGLGVTINYNGGAGTSIPTVFETVTGIQVPVDPTTGLSLMEGRWTLSSVAPDATVTQLGLYYPPETTPSYRRYRFGVQSVVDSTLAPAVSVLVRRRYMPVSKETDWVVPGNLGALKFAMQAINTEAARNDASALWKGCADILNDELHATRGAARPEMNYEVLGGMQGFGNVY